MGGYDDERAAARRLFDEDRVDDARTAYLALVTLAPSDAAVLGDAGTFFFKTGALAAAQTAFERAVAIDPDDPRALVNLGNACFARGAFEAARARYAAAVALDSGAPEAHQGLSYALVQLGREEEAAPHRRLGFAGRSVVTAPFRGRGRPIDVLVLVAAAGGTIFTDPFLDDRIFRTTSLVADVDGTAAVPPHAVTFNALADADRVGPALAAMHERFGAAPKVINAPLRVLATTREENARRFGEFDGVRAPRVARIARDALERSGAAALQLRGFTFPLLLRSPGYQTGRHFVRVDTPADLADAVAVLPGDALLAIAFVDVRSGDGAVRKYRMMTIDGVLYPLHVAVAREWKVHYFTADMHDAAYRAEDARFLADPEAVLGPRVMDAIERIARTLGLDYAGIDFSLDRDGRVVVFEANATMIVLPPGTEPIWDYRRAPVQRAIDAVRTMLRTRAQLPERPAG